MMNNTLKCSSDLVRPPQFLYNGIEIDSKVYIYTIYIDYLRHYTGCPKKGYLFKLAR